MGNTIATGDNATTATSDQTTTETTTAPGQEPAAGGDDLTPEQLRDALTEARREAAKYRTERNNLRPLAEKYREQEEAAKTEDQKIAEKIAALEAKNQELLLEKTRTAVASTAGLPPELVKGVSEDELTAHAEALQAHIEAKVAEAVAAAGPSNVGPQVPGENAGGTPIAETDWLRAMFNQT